MNLAILIGVLSSPIRIDTLPSGAKVARFRVKTFNQYTADGEQRESSQTHLIDVYSTYLQNGILKLLKEGQMIEVQGAMESRNAAKAGEPARWMTSVVIRGNGVVSVFGGAKSLTAVTANAAESSAEAEPRVDHSPRQSAPPPSGPKDGLDDDIPF